jgi:hypothetical protein
MGLIEWGKMAATGRHKDDEEKRKNALLLGLLRGVTGIIAGLDFVVNNTISYMQGFSRGIDAPGFQIANDFFLFLAAALKAEKRSVRRNKKTKAHKVAAAGAEVIGDLGLPTPFAKTITQIYTNAIEELEKE